MKYTLFFFDKDGNGYKVVNFSPAAFCLWKELREKDYQLVERIWDQAPWHIWYEVRPHKKSPPPPLCYC